MEGPGLDFFHARYFHDAQGRFTGVDPVTITPRRLGDPQQLNAYAYVRNSPLRLADRSGKVLEVSGSESVDVGYLCLIAGDASDRLSTSVDEVTGATTVNFDTTGLDLTKNEGAALINDLVQSGKTYDLTIGWEVQVAQGTLLFDQVENLDNQSSHAPIADQFTPRPGVDDQIAVNNLVRSKSTTGLNPAQTWTVVFHELAEAYAKVDGGEKYADAHEAAAGRENRLRDQRPSLKQDNPGSGPGDKHERYHTEQIIKR